jgi:hypothetical protein
MHFTFKYLYQIGIWISHCFYFCHSFGLYRIFLVHLMMRQWLRLWSCTRSRIDNGQFLKRLPLKEKVFLKVWTGKLSLWNEFLATVLNFWIVIPYVSCTSLGNHSLLTLLSENQSLKSMVPHTKVGFLKINDFKLHHLRAQIPLYQMELLSSEHPIGTYLRANILLEHWKQ